MQFVLSITQPLAKWLALNLSPPLAQNGKRITTQQLISDSQQMAWQCHVLAQNGLPTLILAMEAYSRYVIVLPFSGPPSQAELEYALLARWGNEALHLAIESGAINDDELPLMVDAFSAHPCQAQWILNTDLSIQTHLNQAANYLEQALAKEPRQLLDEQECYMLGAKMNQQQKTVMGANKKFRPMVRFLTQTLYRFGEGLAEREYPNTKVGNFPCPYPQPLIKAKVIKLSDYKKQRFK
ncbi:hypothetical protein [Oceanisphaera avium]|uniref:Uncharacterized protein n=1 Tax=Oceanisphaera avium TaxID=1903694 RepID=A0A1Y0CVQ3_9GAMM|nr:hypothetical protein [Oceanisphaera avium]ART79329.1 hypothetical protein CBP12_03505 [Oceanisphaera avium]